MIWHKGTNQKVPAGEHREFATPPPEKKKKINDWKRKIISNVLKFNQIWQLLHKKYILGASLPSPYKKIKKNKKGAKKEKNMMLVTPLQEKEKDRWSHISFPDNITRITR